MSLLPQLTFFSVSGVALLEGGAGADHLLVRDLRGTVRVEGGSGSDLIEIEYGFGTISSGAGSDRIVIVPYGDRGWPILDFTAQGPEADVLSLPTLNWVDPATTASARIGQQGSDVLIYHPEFATTYVRLIGVDVGDLSAASFDGADVGPFWTVGSDGADTLQGGDGVDRLEGSYGDDLLLGGGGDDHLWGGPGADRIVGGPGADTIRLRQGVVAIGPGDTSADRPDILIGQLRSFDEGRPAFATIDFTAVVPSVVTIEHYADQAVVTAVAPDGQTVGRIVSVGGAYYSGFGVDGGNIETGNPTLGADIFDRSAANAYGQGPLMGGGPAGDRIQGGDGANYIYGNGGDDTINGGRGADTLAGGSGADVFAFRPGDSTTTAPDLVRYTDRGLDVLDLTALGSGVTTLSWTGDQRSMLVAFAPAANGPSTSILIEGELYGSDLRLAPGSGADLLGRGDWGDLLRGTIGPDRLFGFESADTLLGEAGDDELFGDAGADTLTGGAGRDRFSYRAASDSAFGHFDTITDFTVGQDQIDLYYLQPSAVSLNRVNGATLIFASARGNLLSVGVNALLNATDVNTVVGIDMVGDATGETLIGANAGDRLFGLGGDDSLNGGGGDDQLFGDAGADGLNGGEGRDRYMYRSAGDSTAAAFDTIFNLASGHDKLDFSFLPDVRAISLNKSGVDTWVFVATEQGAMQIYVRNSPVEGDDVVLPGSLTRMGLDMVGDAGSDLLRGSSGDDRLFGLGSLDNLYGGDGADQLFGDGERDFLVGGAGADRFSYRGVGDSVVGAADVVFDFQLGVDKIDLSLVRTGAADRIGWAVKDGDTFVFVDLGGDGTLDMEIALKGVVGLQASDFVP